MRIRDSFCTQPEFRFFPPTDGLSSDTQSWSEQPYSLKQLTLVGSRSPLTYCQSAPTPIVFAVVTLLLSNCYGVC